MIRFLIHRSLTFLIVLLIPVTAVAGEIETIGIKTELTVHLYGSFSELHKAYMQRGGEERVMKRVKGFYSDRDNSIHCVKWDFYTCGHELFHALQYKGDRSLIVEKDFQHFRENTYTRQ